MVGHGGDDTLNLPRGIIHMPKVQFPFPPFVLCNDVAMTNVYNVCAHLVVGLIL
jgi:hypothetical protein